MPMLLEDYL
jgi:hypothetical protein